MKNPCVGCGACCAHFRVQFYWREGEASGQPENLPEVGANSAIETNDMDTKLPVRPANFEDLDDRYRCMKGTNDKHHPKCVGLKGRIGQNANCGIYSERPTPCREFAASFADGKMNPRCDQARKAHGLNPLTPRDWMDETHSEKQTEPIADSV
jgi:Fe-S-cluster containining protein